MPGRGNLLYLFHKQDVRYRIYHDMELARPLAPGRVSHLLAYMDPDHEIYAVYVYAYDSYYIQDGKSQGIWPQGMLGVHGLLADSFMHGVSAGTITSTLHFPHVRKPGFDCGDYRPIAIVLISQPQIKVQVGKCHSVMTRDRRQQFSQGKCN